MSKEFGRIRSFLWPIYKKETRMFLPLFLIFFFVGFNYSILRATKDALVVTAPASGAEALPFLKVWAILPMAFLFTFLFTRVSNWLSRERVFYAMMTIFLLFFILFMFVLYPYRDHLHPHAFADSVQAHLPVGFQGFIAIFRNWTFTAFYIMSEMWSTIIMTVLCWGFVNETTTVGDAKRFYGLLGIGINFSGIAAGQVATLLSAHTFNPHLPFGTDAWGQSIFFLNCLVILVGLVCMFLFRWLHKNGYGYSSAKSSDQQEEPIKMGMRKNFAYLAKSKYLICIALIVITYNIVINLTEVVWKDQVKQLYPNPSDFNAYMGKVLTGIGVIATVTSVFISGNVIRRLSWTSSAMISPLILLVTSVGFFSFLLFKDLGLGFVAGLLGSTSLAMSVFFGSLQNCLSRASKYTLFDATKELAFIPLSQESKLKGKAAIDGVGSRLGKSGGSIIHQGLLVFFGSISLSTPYVGLILLGSIVIWMMSVRSLGKKFNDLTAKDQTLDLPDALAEEKEPALQT